MVQIRPCVVAVNHVPGCPRFESGQGGPEGRPQAVCRRLNARRMGGKWTWRGRSRVDHELLRESDRRVIRS